MDASERTPAIASGMDAADHARNRRESMDASAAVRETGEAPAVSVRGNGGLRPGRWRSPSGAQAVSVR